MTTLVGTSDGPERNGDLVFFGLNGAPFAIGPDHAILLGQALIMAGQPQSTVDDGRLNP